MGTSEVRDLFRLDGRVAVVTGASRGIGAATALALADAGADVVVAARGQDALEGVAAAIRERGRKSEAVAADLSELSALPGVVDAAVSGLGRLDVLVNVVGGTMPRGFLDTSPGYMERAFHFEVSVAYEMTRLSAPHLLRGSRGSVINIASAMGRLADRGYVAYGTGKAALIHMTKLLALDLAPKTRVNVIAPGAIETEALGTVLNDEMRQTMVSMTPMRRLGAPEDIAAAALYLASDASSYVTGKMLEVDGGLVTPNLPLGMPDL
jgi:7-alpha-hydroxysteroid dehydrogenase